MDSPRAVPIQVPSFEELYDALPKQWQRERFRQALLDVYRAELHCLIAAALHPDCQEPSIIMEPWVQIRDQWVARFCTNDTSLPWTPAVNWYSQMTSQWR